MRRSGVAEKEDVEPDPTSAAAGAAALRARGRAALPVPAHVQAATPGYMWLAAGDGGAVCWIRSTEWIVASLPRRCEVTLRLAFWDEPPVFVTLLLLRLGRRKELTYEFWPDPGWAEGLQTLCALGQHHDLTVNLVTATGLVRQMRGPSHIDLAAKELHRMALARSLAWRTDAYDAARSNLAQAQRSLDELWRVAAEWHNARPDLFPRQGHWPVV